MPPLKIDPTNVNLESYAAAMKLVSGGNNPLGVENSATVNGNNGTINPFGINTPIKFGGLTGLGKGGNGAVGAVNFMGNETQSNLFATNNNYARGLGGFDGPQHVKGGIAGGKLSIIG